MKELLILTVIAGYFFTSCAEQAIPQKQGEEQAAQQEQKDSDETQVPAPIQADNKPQVQQPEAKPEQVETQDELYVKIFEILKVLPFETLGLDKIHDGSLIQYVLKNFPVIEVAESFEDLKKSIFDIVFKALISGGDVDLVAFENTSLLMKSIEGEGSNCNANNMHYDISTDGQAFTIIFDDFQIETSGKNTEEKEIVNADCKLKIKLNAPKGWAYAVSSFEQYGYALLGEGSKLYSEASYKIEGDEGNVELNTQEIAGPFDDNFLQSSKIKMANLKFTGCEKDDALIIDTKIRIESDINSSGYTVIETIDSEIKKSFKLIWKKCDEV